MAENVVMKRLVKRAHHLDEDVILASEKNRSEGNEGAVIGG